MERLNHILGRTPARQQRRDPQSATQQSYTQEQASQPPMRQTRPISEPVTRNGQRSPYASRALPPSQQRQPEERRPRETRDLAARNNNNNAQQAMATYPDPTQQRPTVPPARTTHSQYERPQEYIQRRPERSSAETIRLRAITPRRAGYYRPDDFAPHQQQADALDTYADENEYEEYEEYEDDEDQEGIQYGNWEGSEEDFTQPAYHYPTRVEQSSPSLNQSRLPAPYVQEPAPPYLANPDRSTYNEQSGAPYHGQQQTRPPRPGAPLQEPRQQHRFTQPLNPQAVSGLTREQERGETARMIRPALPQPQTSNKLPEPLPAVSLPVPQRNACPRCRGVGFVRENVPYGHPHFGKAIACECKEAERKEKRRQQLRTMSDLDAYRHQNFQTFNPRVPGVQEAFQAACDFAEGWLLMIGPNGCGKTHLAIAIAQQALEQGAVVLFEPVPDLLDHLRAAFSPTAEEVYDQLFAKMREAELLILDDLGSQQSSQWANEKLFQLLNYRYNMRLPTVITTNTRAYQGIEERIRSRLSDIGLVQKISLDRAHDFRPHNPRRY